jgi:hypothetical protein
LPGCGTEEAHQGELAPPLGDRECIRPGDDEHRHESRQSRDSGKKLHPNPPGTRVHLRFQGRALVVGQDFPARTDNGSRRFGDRDHLGARRQPKPDGPYARRQRFRGPVAQPEAVAAVGDDAGDPVAGGAGGGEHRDARTGSRAETGPHGHFPIGVRSRALAQPVAAELCRRPSVSGCRAGRRVAVARGLGIELSHRHGHGDTGDLSQAGRERRGGGSRPRHGLDEVGRRGRGGRARDHHSGVPIGLGNLGTAGGEQQCAEADRGHPEHRGEEGAHERAAVPGQHAASSAAIRAAMPPASTSDMSSTRRPSASSNTRPA